MENFFKFCDLNELEHWLVMRLYIAASLPIILLIYYTIKNKVSYSVAMTLISVFLIASIKITEKTKINKKRPNKPNSATICK